MLKNYVLIAVRSLLRNKLFSFINIAGLALSLSVGMIIIMLVADQMSYDRYNTKAPNIYRINQEDLEDTGPFTLRATTAPAVAQDLSDNYSGIRSMTRLRRGFGNDWLPIGDNENIPIGGFFADENVLDFFEYDLELGDPKTALVKPRTVVLTKEAAEKVFEQANPMGEFVKVGKLGDFEVTGIIKDSDQKSHIKFEALASMASLQQLVQDSLVSSDQFSYSEHYSGWSYIELEEGVEPATIEAHLAKINDEQYADNEDINIRYFLQGLLKINPGPLMGNQIGPGIPLFMVYFLGVLSLLIIISACFNYTTLSVARAMSRAREVGIRKASGALKKQVFAQFVTEAIVVAFLSLTLSFLFLPVLVPAFEQLRFAQMLFWDLSLNSTVVITFVVFTLMVGLMAGLFPSIFMSSVKPVTVLRGVSSMKLLSKVGLRKSLIVAQFVLSLFLIISTRLVQEQVTMMTDADYGFNSENIINVRIYDTSYDHFKAQLENKSGITSVSGSSHVPGIGTSRSFEAITDNPEEPVRLNYFGVDKAYLDQMGLELMHGSGFPENADLDREQFLIINETGAKALGYSQALEAVGKSVITEDSLNLQIVGVVKDYNHVAMVTEISPLVLRLLPNSYRIAQVKYSGDRTAAVATIETAWKQVNPDLKIAYQDMDDEIADFYDFAFSDIVSITSFVSFLAIMIACLGLLGMTVYTAETKAKEVSIRKVLGAGFKDVVISLSKGYGILLLISVVIALPMSIVLNNLWLESLAYHVSVSSSTVAFGVLIILLLGGVTVLSQTLKAANSNAVEKLRGD